MSDAWIEPGDERIDWRGQPIACDGCAHVALAREGRCRPGHACVEDRYARRIDRFFDWNPDLADSHVRHPHFEVRAIAAKQADLFLLPALLDDPEEAVRWNAARRLPARYKLKLRTDPHREVRIRIAASLDGAELAPMLRDCDYYVRLVAARRIDPPLLHALIADPEPEVRRVVASRLPAAMLAPMAYDEDAGVRLCVVGRMSADAINHMRGDADWRVRHAVASATRSRIVLRELAQDTDPIVRETAAGRLDRGDAIQPEMAS
ncbi:MAG: LRV FeS4 cluster domain-containing protein [Novosphingobium sp.]|nr:LRV FeS4 cluster domain-containing protein [Novosphingobium sp.]